jgi:hypothetical protein
VERKVAGGGYPSEGRGDVETENKQEEQEEEEEENKKEEQALGRLEDLPTRSFCRMTFLLHSRGAHFCSRFYFPWAHYHSFPCR